MKLYYSPGSCSLSPHIALQEAGLSYSLEKVNLRTKITESGADFTQINTKGSVPTLELENGERLTEGPAIVQWIADQAPAANLAPANGTFARARLQEMLNYIGTEIHKSYGPLFSPVADDATKAAAIAKIQSKYQWLEAKLAGQDYLLGDSFSVADGYLFVTLGWWVNAVKQSLVAQPNLAAFQARVFARPAVQAAMRAEGLLA